MARASIASLGPSARRGARGIARVARQDRDVLSGDRRDRGAKRSGVSRHSGVFLLVPFLCTSKEKEPTVGQPPTSNTRAKPARLIPLSLILSRQGRGEEIMAEPPASKIITR
ncbi:MAG: hypothetical protein A3D32_02860 [Candidatus Muproteobacteria bacterium RIFCSPHIGHO2_02_FULL_60_13]|nr:MAG: hypothetical protein A3D32_02860 [Candidatus Muproteobacteria bacterium RIFCSPHIGHO2_02_FULL_60_13]